MYGVRVGICRAICVVVSLCTLYATSLAQMFEVFNLDPSAHPTMRGTVIYAPNGVKNTPITASDIRITDMGVTVPVTSVSCQVVPPEPLHICIILDFKNYRPLVRYGLRRLINQLPMPEADVAILSTYEHVQVIQDYTRDRAKALAAVDAVTESPGLDLERAFYSLPNGCIPFSEGRTGKTMIVFVSDLHCPKFNLDENKLYADAKKNSMSVSSILLGTSDITGVFRRIATTTQGVVHENVKSEEGFDVTIAGMWSVAYGSCKIEWESPPSCNATHTVAFDHAPSGLSDSSSYAVPILNVASWYVEPRFIRVVNTPGVELDSLVGITARLKRTNIVNIITEPPSIIAEPTSMVIDTVHSTRMRVRWMRSASEPPHGLVTIVTDDCKRMYLHLSMQDSVGAPDPIRLLVPNGGEEHTGGTKAVLTYGGVADDVPVNAFISTNKGSTWKEIGTSRGGTMTWDVPPTPSDECLARIEAGMQGSLSVLDSAVLADSSTSEFQWLVDPLERWILLAGGDSTTVYDFETMTPLFRLPIKGATENGSLSMSENGRYVAVGSDSGVVVLYDGDTWVERRRMKVSNDHGTPAVTITASGEFILVRGDNKDYQYGVGLTLFDSTGTVLFDSNDVRARAADIHPDGEYIAWGYYGAGFLWRRSDHSVSTFTTNDPNATVRGVQFSRGGEKLAIGEGGFEFVEAVSVMIVNVATSSVITDVTPKYSFGGPFSLDYGKLFWTKNGAFLFAGPSPTVMIDAVTFEVLTVIETVPGSRTEKNFDTYSVSPDGLFVSTTKHYDDSVRVYDAFTGKLIVTFKYVDRSSFGHGTMWGNTADYLYMAPHILPRRVLRTSFRAPGGIIPTDTSDALWRIVSPIPDLQVTRIDMGTVPMGLSKDSTVQGVLCNRGPVPLPVQSIVVSSGNLGDFNIPVGGGAFTLAPSECRDIVVDFMPMAEGYREARITVKTDVGAFTDTIVAFGNGVRDGMSYVNDAIDFGRMPVGTTRDTILVPVMRNSGSTPLRILSAVMAGPDAAAFTLMDFQTGVLASQSNANASVRFRAGEARRHSAWIDVQHDGPLGTMRIHLFGEGLAIVPAIVGSATIRTECSRSADTAVFLTNIGEGRMIVTSVSIDAASRFRLLTIPELPFTIWPGDTVRLAYQYIPTGASIDTASLSLIVEGYAPNGTMRIPLRGQSSFTSFTIAPESVIIVDAILGSFKDTVLTLSTNVASPTTVQLSVSGDGVVLTGVSSIVIPAGTQSIDIPVRCTAISEPTTIGGVVITSQVCTGNMSVPVFTSTTSLPSGDTLTITVSDVSANIGEEFAMIVTAFVPPSVAAQVGSTLKFDLQWNASMALPTSAPLLQPLTLQGVTASLPVTLDFPPGGGAVTITIPSRALLGTDSLSALHINPTSLPTTVPHILNDGLLTVHGLCIADGTMRRFDPLANAPIAVQRSVSIIVLDIPVRDANACRVTVMDVRGALVASQPTLTREVTNVRCVLDTTTLAHGRYVIVVERDGTRTSIPLVH